MISPTLQAFVSQTSFIMSIKIHPQVPQYSRPPDHLISSPPLMHLIQNHNRLLLLSSLALILLTWLLIC